MLYAKKNITLQSSHFLLSTLYFTLYFLFFTLYNNYVRE